VEKKKSSLMNKTSSPVRKSGKPKPGPEIKKNEEKMILEGREEPEGEVSGDFWVKAGCNVKKTDEPRTEGTKASPSGGQKKKKGRCHPGKRQGSPRIPLHERKRRKNVGEQGKIERV